MPKFAVWNFEQQQVLAFFVFSCSVTAALKKRGVEENQSKEFAI